MEEGCFSKPAYITVGDEYDKRATALGKEVQAAPRPFLTAPSKKGRTKDAFFDQEFKPLCQGDKYIDPGTREKLEALEKKKKMLNPIGFSYTSKNLTKDGCFSASPAHETEYRMLKKGELPAARPPAPKNFYTSPGRKGTSTTPGITIGEKMPDASEYKYISNPYDSVRRKQELERREGANKMAGTIPFRTAVRKVGTFDENGVGVSKLYGLDKPLPARRPPPPPIKKAVEVAFKPSGPNTKVPTYEYKEDPYDMKERLEREAMKKQAVEKVWKPVSGAKSTLQRSIAFS
jgi:hypothetical protein